MLGTVLNWCKTCHSITQWNVNSIHKNMKVKTTISLPAVTHLLTLVMFHIALCDVVMSFMMLWVSVYMFWTHNLDDNCNVYLLISSLWKSQLIFHISVLWQHLIFIVKVILPKPVVMVFLLTEKNCIVIIISFLLFEGSIRYELLLVFGRWFFTYFCDSWNSLWHAVYQLFIISPYHYGYIKMTVVVF